MELATGYTCIPFCSTTCQAETGVREEKRMRRRPTQRTGRGRTDHIRSLRLGWRHGLGRIFGLLLVLLPWPSAEGHAADRVVLLELFTSSGCPPCVAGDLALDRLLEEHSSKELAVLAYHMHAGSPDPMATWSSMARMRFYETRGAPTFFVDGKKASEEGGNARKADAIHRKLQKKIEQQRGESSEISLQASAIRRGDTLDVEIRIRPAEVFESSEGLVLHVALVERMLQYTGSNGIDHHPMVVRQVLGEGEGIPLPSLQKPSTFQEKFSIEAVQSRVLDHLEAAEQELAGRGGWRGFDRKMHVIDPDQLLLVAFVQNPRSRAVLQAIVVEPRPAGTRPEP